MGYEDRLSGQQDMIEDYIIDNYEDVHEDCIRQIEFYQDFVDKLMAENHYSDKDKTKERLHKLSIYVLDKMIDNPQFEAWNYVYDEIHKIRKAI